jgi:hypothetical protein
MLSTIKTPTLCLAVAALSNGPSPKSKSPKPLESLIKVY